jgi:hypothetical protein
VIEKGEVMNYLKIIGIVGVFLVGLMLCGCYQIVPAGQGFGAFRMNRLTGSVAFCSPYGGGNSSAEYRSAGCHPLIEGEPLPKSTPATQP